MLIGLSSLVLGAGGAVASGAIEVGSEGSLGDNWVQVEGVNQAVSLGSFQTDTGGQSSEGVTTSSTGVEPNADTDDSDDPGDPDDSDDSDNNGGGGGGGGGGGASTRAQVIRDPNNPGNAVGAGTITWNGSVASDNAINGSTDGFFSGIEDTNVNTRGTTVYGTLSGGTSGYPTTPTFIIANVGPTGGGPANAPVSVSATLYDDGTEVATDQLRFPYRAVDASGTTFDTGSDLFGSAVTLSVGDVIEVAVVFDTNGGSDDIENATKIKFSATAVSP
ncbi:MAG: hypothetical protein J07HN6_01710 [Halonotius sp. J07HN6]|nr:MAG: hypothetical protein J07HN6_01710 [Halonotius sp. J07HN6]ERH05576.1 MAG: hypothetical protein J07HN4v3_01178 [Halonotius sp. J07HN4]